MKKALSILFLSLIAVSSLSLNKKSLYDTMASKSEEVIMGKIKFLSDQKASSDTRAFKGIYLMISAQFYYAPWSKWNAFSSGRDMLEKEIKSDPNNAEFRFLRLMIQENAPSIVGYSDNIAADTKIVKKDLKTLDADTQAFIKKYAKTSKNLKGI